MELPASVHSSSHYTYIGAFPNWGSPVWFSGLRPLSPTVHEIGQIIAHSGDVIRSQNLHGGEQVDFLFNFFVVVVVVCF